jgi:hypothetical protein
MWGQKKKNMEKRDKRNPEEKRKSNERSDPRKKGDLKTRRSEAKSRT